jgi:Tol biopolymer transport system component
MRLAIGALAILVACGGKVYEQRGSTGDGGTSASTTGDGGALLTGGSGGAAGSAGGGSGLELLGSPVRCAGLPAEVARAWIAFDSDRDGRGRSIYMVRADGSDLTRVTASPGFQREPAFSPDGKSLAYASDAAGTMQVHVLRFGSLADVSLTRRPDGADQPTWSRDGTFLAFHSGASVYRIDADGKNERLIATGTDDFNAYMHPSLSDDGQTVVFDRNNEIDAVPVGGGAVRYVVQNTTTTIETPAVRGDTVAFAVYCAGEQIALVPFAGSTQSCSGTFVTRSQGTARRPAWGPKDYLAYELGEAYNAPALTKITIISGPGGTPCTVYGDTWDNRNPAFAPDGF